MGYLFQSDLPYPEADINIKSDYEVKLLMPVYGGREGETSAVLGYVYGHYVTQDVEGELSDCLKKLAVVEMRHHDMLGRAIFRLGGTPYIGGNYSYWQGAYLNYGKNPSHIIKTSIMNEEQAIHDYLNVCKKTKMEEVKLIVNRIILDEEVHLELLKKLQELYR